MWVQTADALGRLAGALRGVPELALDTEGDSLHHYPGRLALIQVAEPGGGAWLLDPLAIPDLGPLGRLCADPATTLVLHAGDNDLAHLKGRHGFTFCALFDTAVAARFLGARALGLDTLLAEHLGVTLPPSRQKDDWSVRPLSAAQERYALADVQHLLALKACLLEHLVRAGRLAWVEEECAALAAEPVAPAAPDPDAWTGVKGARELGPASLAALRELYAARERLALAGDRPPFKVLGEATLLALAQARPEDVEALRRVPGCTPRVVDRWGPTVLAAVARARALPPEEWPVLPRHRRPPAMPADMRRRVEALQAWRATAATRYALDAGVLLPNRLIHAIAAAAPRDAAGLAAVAGVRRWRADALGPELLAALSAS